MSGSVIGYAALYLLSVVAGYSFAWACHAIYRALKGRNK